MRRIHTVLFTVLAVLFFFVSYARALRVPLVLRVGEKIYVVGNNAAKTGLTVIDLNTGLEWEKKCSCGGLHDQNIRYPWSGNGSEETIWDWLDDVNAEGGSGYAGHSDWRIPNLKELQSIVDYGVSNPAVHPAFNNAADSFTLPRLYWSSTTRSPLTSDAWFVDFSDGSVGGFDKSIGPRFIRAVRSQ